MGENVHLICFLMTHNSCDSLSDLLFITKYVAPVLTKLTKNLTGFLPMSNVILGSLGVIGVLTQEPPGPIILRLFGPSDFEDHLTLGVP